MKRVEYKKTDIGGIPRQQIFIDGIEVDAKQLVGFTNAVIEYAQEKGVEINVYPHTKGDK